MNFNLPIICILAVALGWVTVDAYFKPKPLTPCIVEPPVIQSYPQSKKEIKAFVESHRNQDKGVMN